jgi:hypothetical protein
MKHLPLHYNPYVEILFSEYIAPPVWKDGASHEKSVRMVEIQKDFST